MPSHPENKYGIERLKALGDPRFNISDRCRGMVKHGRKCFDVMDYTEGRKVKLATFLLQKEADGWWKYIFVRRSDAKLLGLANLQGHFQGQVLSEYLL